MNMAMFFGDMTEWLSSWAERCRCRCHELVQRDHKEYLLAHVLREECGPELARDMTTMPCPFRGCSAPDLASGGVFEMLESAYKDALARLVLECRSDLEEPTWTGLLQELRAGKAYGNFILTAKRQSWQELPWLLCVRAHPSEAKARKGAASILRKYARLPVGAPNILHHPLARKFPSPSALRDLGAFASGHPRDFLPGFKRAVLPLAGIPITDRNVQAPPPPTHTPARSSAISA